MDTQHLHIRPARLDDAAAIFGLTVSLAMSYKPDRTAFDASLPSIIASSDTMLTVAESGGIVAAYALAVRIPTFYANGAIVELVELIVEESRRGEGIGTLLVESMLEWARAGGAVEVTTMTRRARDYYLRLGFEETASYFKRKL